MARGREIGIRLALVLVSVVITAIALELVFRWLAPPVHEADGSFDPRHPLLRILEPNTCKMDGSPEGTYFVEVCTNRLGLRDRDHLEPEDPRVLLLGDSFTFGWGVSFDDTYAARVERALREALPGRRPGVHNAGISFTSQVHQDMLARHLWPQVQPSVVVLAFAEDNDIDENIMWNPQLGVFPYLGKVGERPDLDAQVRSLVVTDELYRASGLVRFFRHRTLRSSLRDEVSALEERIGGGAQTYRLDVMVRNEAERRFLQMYSDRHAQDWQITTLLLDRIAELVASKGARLVLLRIPSRLSVVKSAFDGTIKQMCGQHPAAVRAACGELDQQRTRQRLQAWASEHDVALIDPTQTLIEAHERGEVLYHPEDIHLNRLGHYRTAQGVAPELVRAVGGDVDHAVDAPTRPQGERWVGAYWFAEGAVVGNDEAAAREAAQVSLHAAERAEVDVIVPVQTVPSTSAQARALELLREAWLARHEHGRTALKMALAWQGQLPAKVDDTLASWQARDAARYLQRDGKPVVLVVQPVAPQTSPAGVSLIEVGTPQLPLWSDDPSELSHPTLRPITPGVERWPSADLLREGTHTLVQQWQRALASDPTGVLVYSINRASDESGLWDPPFALQLQGDIARRWKDGAPGPEKYDPRRFYPPDGAPAESSKYIPLDRLEIQKQDRRVRLLGWAAPTLRRPAVPKPLGPRVPAQAVPPLRWEVVIRRTDEAARQCANVITHLAGAATPGTGTALRAGVVAPGATLSLELSAPAPCSEAGLQIAGLALKGWPTRRYGLQDPRLSITGLWPMEQGPTGAFAWTQGTVELRIQQLRPGAKVVVALELVEAGRARSVRWGGDGRVATVAPDGMVVGPGEESVGYDGQVRLTLGTETFRTPSDTRELGLQLRAVWVSESLESARRP